MGAIRARIIRRPAAEQGRAEHRTAGGAGQGAGTDVIGGGQGAGTDVIGGEDQVTGLRRLLTPASGLLGQGTRYALAGAFVGLVYVLTTTFLAVVVGLPFREALAIGFALQLAVHFTLQRTFVWVHEEEFALPIRHQTGRYLAVAGAQLGLTAASTSLLPSVLGVSAEVVYLGTVALLTTVNFLLFRNVVFHPMHAGADPAGAGVDPAGAGAGPAGMGVDPAGMRADANETGADPTRAGAEIGM